MEDYWILKNQMGRHNGTTATCLFLILVDSFCFFFLMWLTVALLNKLTLYWIR